LYHNINILLWDTKNPLYYNKIKKNDAWEEIAVELHTTVDECKKKMNALLSALRREKAKIKRSQGTGRGMCK
jgi:predicted neutral ceramidase superfamily lipid hydrolase